MQRTALYAGSFDPVTLGHIDLIERATALFDRIVVAIGHNIAKKTWFSVQERERLMRASCAHLPTVQVVVFEGLLVEAAAKHKAQVLLRGLRALSDFDLEFRNGLANRDLAGFETLFLLTNPKHIFVSSSICREIASHGGDISRYVPQVVHQAVQARVSGSCAE